MHFGVSRDQAAGAAMTGVGSRRDGSASIRLDPDGYWLLTLAIVVRQRWGLLLVTTLLVTIVAATTAFLATPQYETRVVMLPAPDTDTPSSIGGLLGDFGGLAALAGANVPGGQLKNEALAILRSRSFTESFIVAANLMPELFSDRWNAEQEVWRDGDAPTLFDAFELFDEDVRQVSENLSEGTITLSITWRDREKAALWANELVTRLNANARERAIDQASRTLDYLKEELQKTNVLGVKQAIYGLVEENIRTIALANVRQEFAFKIIDPAAPPDEDGYVRPKRVLIIVAGIGVGFILGLLLAIGMTRMQEHGRTID